MTWAVAAVLFPGLEPYWPDFFASWAAQQGPTFHLLLLLEDLEPEAVRAALRPYPALAARTRFRPAPGNPARNRCALLQWALDAGYTTLVFADADDRFSPWRLARVQAALARTALVGHDVALIDARGRLQRARYLARRWPDQMALTPQRLCHANGVGFSTLALRLEPLRARRARPPCPPDLVAVDWYLVTWLLRQGYEGRFLAEPLTAYRQHARNLVGLGQPPTLAHARRSLAVKARHYTALAQAGWPAYEALAQAARATLAQLDLDSAFARRYTHYIQQRLPRPLLWWEAGVLWPDPRAHPLQEESLCNA
ncbi:MAG: hypothetical protein GXO36_04180 [Chloroflexi bacterium]|nr:hypothetical protein [Chloroflexota bacterium]